MNTQNMVTVEVNAEIGTFVKVPKSDNLEEAVKQAILDKLNIDNKDVILNNLTICNYQ